MKPEYLEKSIIEAKYTPSDDPERYYHKFYFGEIVEMYGDMAKNRMFVIED